MSISASIASATFTHACQSVVNFDSRVWLGVDKSQVLDYFRWRQADATRCALNGWCYWTLRKASYSVRQAAESGGVFGEGVSPSHPQLFKRTAMLEGRSVGFKNELLFQQGINFNDLPTWQRRGVGLYWEEYHKQGYNPIQNTTVVTTRRRIKVDEELPMKEAYADFLNTVIDAHCFKKA